MPDLPPPPVALFKKPKKNKNLRKRLTPPSVAPSHSESDSTFDSNSDTDADPDAVTDSNLARLTKRRKIKPIASTITAATHITGEQQETDVITKATVFEAERTGITSVNDATKRSDWYEGDVPSKKYSPPTASISDPSASAAPLDSLYYGLSARRSFSTDSSRQPPKTIGPQKSSSTIRIVTTIDYAADVCKDYKKTGFCGFGDNCKFAHDRSDTAAGWKLDKEWEIKSKGRALDGVVVAARTGRDTESRGEQKNGGGLSEDDVKYLLSIPPQCPGCQGVYKGVMVPGCGHFVCGTCVINEYVGKKKKKCFVCGMAHGGSFRKGERLEKVLEKKRKWEEAEEERKREVEAES